MKIYSPPEIIGLRLGGAFELDPLRLKLIEQNLIVQGVATTQLIEAVGVVKIDASTTVLRFYTDDDGYLEILLDGGMEEQNIADVKMWYFYDTGAIQVEREWNNVLQNKVSKPNISLDGRVFERVWNAAVGNSIPVSMTEKTYTSDNQINETDQFIMLYERAATDDLTEYLRMAGEERTIGGQFDRCMVRATGFDIRPADIEIIG